MAPTRARQRPQDDDQRRRDLRLKGIAPVGQLDHQAPAALEHQRHAVLRGKGLESELALTPGAMARLHLKVEAPEAQAAADEPDALEDARRRWEAKTA